MNMYDATINRYNMEPIENMGSNLGLFIQEKVLISINNIEKENNNKFPDAISKIIYIKKLNNILDNIFKDEEKIKNIIDRTSRCDKRIDSYFNRALSDFTNYIMITEFMKRGCKYCFEND